MNTEPVALQLARRLAEIDLGDAPQRAVDMAITAFIDTVGVSLAGADEPSVKILQQTLTAGANGGPALVLGGRRRTGVLDAALINGTAAHAVDYDDMAEAMGGHPSAPVVPVVLALGESLGSTGRQVLEAYVVGVEAECRLGRVVHPHHYEHGWHPTATLGVFGAAAAASRLLPLDAERTAVALSIAASMASGVKANFGTMTKPLHVGHAARNGLLAAMLAGNGFTGRLGAFEHAQGFFAAFDGLDNVHLDRLFDHWGSRLEIDQDAFGLKQFPCCGSTHPAVLSMLDITSRHAIPPDDVEAIEIIAHRRRLPHTDNPQPTSPLGAKFSIQYATVRALLSGAPRLHHFEGESFLEPEVARLLSRTSARPFPDQSAEWGDEMRTDVHVQLRDGRRLSGRADSLGRGPTNPMSQAEMWQKFNDCSSRALPQEQARSAFESLYRLQGLERIADALAQLTPPEAWVQEREQADSGRTE